MEDESPCSDADESVRDANGRDLAHLTKLPDEPHQKPLPVQQRNIGASLKVLITWRYSGAYGGDGTADLTNVGLAILGASWPEVDGDRWNHRNGDREDVEVEVAWKIGSAVAGLETVGGRERLSFAGCTTRTQIGSKTNGVTVPLPIVCLSVGYHGSVFERQYTDLRHQQFTS